MRFVTSLMAWTEVNLMKLLRTLSASLLTVGAFASPALAQTENGTGIYGSLGYAETFRQGADLGAVDLRLGDRFSRYFGVETELGIGTNSDVATDLGTVARERLNASIAGYGVAFLPLGKTLSLLGRVGVGETRFSINDDGTDATHRDLTSVNYGAGAMYNLSSSNTFRFDYTRKSYEHGGGDDDTLSASLVHRF